MQPMTTMYLSCLVASTLVAMATCAGNEYLPPQQKGYNYPQPEVPFPTNNNGNKQPTPPPFRPSPPTRGPSYVPPPPGPPGPPATHDHEDHHHHEPGMPFDFSYTVNEDDNNYSHNAISDGDVTRGEYRVALPDGRTQIVKYTADWKNGFNAQVTYEGEARYPDQAQGYGKGAAAGGGYGKGAAAGGGGYGEGAAVGVGYGKGAAAGSGSGQAYLPPSQGGGYQY